VYATMTHFFSTTPRAHATRSLFPEKMPLHKKNGQKEHYDYFRTAADHRLLFFIFCIFRSIFSCQPILFMKSPTLLFIQGGGKGAHHIDQQLVNYLQQQLADRFTIIYPVMPNEDDPDYNAWKAVFKQELEKTNGPVILIGHSVGGFLLMKFLSENSVHADLKGLLFIAIPFLGDGGWQYEGMFLKDDFAAALPQTPLFFYHSMDDEIVPFHHLALYAQQLPDATIREMAQGGHQLNNDLSVVVTDIRGLGVL